MSGRGTASGVAFQSRVGAYVAALMLAERPLSSLAHALPGAPRRILFETPAPVDDVLIETNGGEIYVQAKNSISLSDKPDSELASVVQQFVRQYRDKVESQSIKRSFHSAKDRLVLAVGATTPATIRDDLREALERNATNAATAFPKALDKAIQTFSNQIGSAWLEETKTPISPQDLTAILSLCRVVSLGDGDERRIVEILSHVIAVPGDETALWNVLKDWAVDASSNGTGADLSSLREYLVLEGGVRLAVAPSFRVDVEKLKAHSGTEFQRVGRFRTLRAPEGDISIDRYVTDAVVAAATKGSLLITGEPGSGKSAVLHAAAEALRTSAPVVFLSVDETAASLDILRREIGLEHRITEVLDAFDGNRPAFLFLDALDAVRGGPADAVYRKLIEEVSALDGWHVIASVRSFDLRMGHELRNLLNGQPPEQQFAEKTFGAVRHIHVPGLSDTEIEQIGINSPTVALALRNADAKLKELVRNPFNLGLLSGLLTSGVQASELASITTRGQLLERYWTERMDDMGLGAEIALSKIASSMLDRRATSLDITLLDPATANIVEENLVGRGLLVKENTGRLAFRHHVLYDFAIARFVLLPYEQSALDRCSRSSCAGLLLAPSLGFWLDEHLRNAPPTDFWQLVISLTATNEVDPIIRVESARLAVELVTKPKDLDCLADAVMADSNGSAVQSVIHLVGALLTRSSSGGNIALIPWANFIARLRPLPHRLLFSARSLLKMLLETVSAPEVFDTLGLASRELMDAVLAHESLASALSAQAIEFVARTYSTDPEGSRHRLARLFEPGRFSRIGYMEVPWLAREIRAVAATDPAFAIEIYRRVFSAADFDHTQETPIGNSWILSMRSNARQDFDMARHHLAEAYRGILESDPTTGARILAVALEGERSREHPYDDSNQPQRFTVNGQNYSIFEDRSSIWAWDIEEGIKHDDYVKIVRTFFGWIPEAPHEQQLSAVEALLCESSMALIWRCVFIAGASQPTSLGLKLWPLVARPEFLFSMDTRQSSISLIAAIYPHLPIHDREKYETEIEDFDFSVSKRPEAAQSGILNRLYAAIGKENLATSSALDRLSGAVEQGESLENKRPFEVRFSREERGHHDWIRGNTSNPPNSDVLALNDRIEAVLSAFKTSPTPDGLAELAAGIQELDRLVESLQSKQLLADVDCTASDTLARGAMAVLKAEPSMEAYQDDFIKLLLRLSEHPLPKTKPETEANFAKSPSWGCPCPRIHAAEAIASIMALPGVWSRVSDAVEQLTLRDAHPAVRMMVVRKLNVLWNEQRDEMWRLVEEVSRREQNTGVIQDLLHVLWRLRGVEPARVETLYLQILDRITSYPKRKGDIVDLLVYFSIVQNLSLSRTRLYEWVSKFEENEERLQAALHRLRDLVVLGYENIKNDDMEIGERARALIIAMLDRIEPALRSWPTRGDEPTYEERMAFKLLGTITDVFFYGTGAGRENEGAVIRTHVGQVAFLRDNTESIRRITQLGTPYSVHHMLEMLEVMVPADPALCFDLISNALLRPAGVARYEHEPLGGDLFVQLVGRYLADYRRLFSDDVRSRRLVDCIAVFVEAGWPEARRLFQNLPELLS
jgi:hypothetical protein